MEKKGRGVGNWWKKTKPLNTLSRGDKSEEREVGRGQIGSGWWGGKKRWEKRRAGCRGGGKERGREGKGGGSESERLRGGAGIDDVERGGRGEGG